MDNQPIPTGYVSQTNYPIQRTYGLRQPSFRQQPQPLFNTPYQPQPQYNTQIMPLVQPTMPIQISPLMPSSMPRYQQCQYQHYWPEPDRQSVNSEALSRNENDDKYHNVIGITFGGKPSQPQQDPVICCDCRLHSKPKKFKKYKSTKPNGKPREGESVCAHTFCIVERAKVKPVGMPWASGLYKYPPAPEQPPKEKVIRRKCPCYKQKCRQVEEEEQQQVDSEPEESCSTQSSSSNFMSKRMKALANEFCTLLNMSEDKRRNSTENKRHSTIYFNFDDNKK